jgi:glucose/arabinose dehydrogenase
VLALVAVFLVTAVPDLIAGSRPAAASVPAGFATTVTQSDLVLPTSFAFARDGRLFVAEKRGTIQTYDSVDDESPSLFADLRRQVHNHLDRGLLSVEVDPGWPLRPFVYVLYSRDAPVGQAVAVYGGTTDSDPCPTAGCPAQTVIARLTADATPAMTASTDLVAGVCTQFPYHDGGGLRFSGGGELYAALGDGATYELDYGQHGGNPCGDPPNEGGTLRAQDVRTPGDPLGYSGTLLRIAPDTGVATMLAFGLRNPYRIAPRPDSAQVWIGDVGLWQVEELNQFTAGDPLRNYGWPCYEGTHRQGEYDRADLPLCESLYAQGGTTPPVDHYCHSPPDASGLCGFGEGAISALAWYGTGSYPAAYHGALFFADYTRETIFVKRTQVGGLHAIETFATGVGAPVDLRTGPGGDLFYADIFDGSIVRIYVGDPAEPPPEVPKPTATIDLPTPDTRTVVGRQLAFSGSAQDEHGAPLPSSALRWTLVLLHCTGETSCHRHFVESREGVSSGSFTVPGHEGNHRLEVVLRATGAQSSDQTSVVLDRQPSRK